MNLMVLQRHLPQPIHLQSKRLGSKRNKQKNSPSQFFEHLGCGGGAQAGRRGLDRTGERRVTCNGAQAR